MHPSPRIRVVVLDLDGGELTLECLRALLRTEWPAAALEIVLVDNGSSNPVTDRVERDMPVIRVIRSERNLGFAAGNNLALRDLEGVDAIALVNNDVIVPPGWLRPLADALVADPSIGATCPKILLAHRYRRLSIDAPARPRWPDPRPLGVRVSGARVGGEDVWRHVRVVSGGWGPELGPGTDTRTWTAGAATLLVPSSAEEPETACLRLDAPDSRTIRVSSGSRSVPVAVGPDAAWAPVPLEGERLDVVHNAGTVLTADGYGADRGYLEADDGQLDREEDVFAWCGAAVLLRAAMLREVGLLDERLFFFYEDVDLAWRALEHGWRTRYVPTSTVRHVHGATIGPNLAARTYLNERNRLIVLARHRGPGAAARAAARLALVTASYARRDVVAPLVRRSRPRGALVAARCRALAHAVREWTRRGVADS